MQAIEGPHADAKGEQTSCIRCHNSVGHLHVPLLLSRDSKKNPRLKTMWAGYAFAKDFREERGHAHMLDDQTFTERQQVTKQPGTCVNCHVSAYTVYKQLGGGDIFKGFETRCAAVCRLINKGLSTQTGACF